MKPSVMFLIQEYGQARPRGFLFTADPTNDILNAVSKLKAQSSKVSFHYNVAKETFEL